MDEIFPENLKIAKFRKIEHTFLFFPHLDSPWSLAEKCKFFGQKHPFLEHFLDF